MIRRSPSPKRRSHGRDKHEVGAWDATLGRRMHFRGMALHGTVARYMTEAIWKRFLIDAANGMGMTPAGKAACWRYPLMGKGGVGYTIVQPITESFLVLDTWPDHAGAYLFVCSCKPFEAETLAEVLQAYNLRQGQAIGAPDALELVAR